MIGGRSTASDHCPVANQEKRKVGDVTLVVKHGMRRCRHAPSLPAHCADEPALVGAEVAVAAGERADDLFDVELRANHTQPSQQRPTGAS
jgi:hypothetical protein